MSPRYRKPRMSQTEIQESRYSGARRRGFLARLAGEGFDCPYADRGFTAPLARAWEEGYRAAVDEQWRLEAGLKINAKP